jgi:putative SOS response-associated peptidase YedK
MPVILDPASEGQWLDPRASVEALHALLAPYRAEWMETRSIGLHVNNPKNDDPSCIEAMSV